MAVHFDPISQAMINSLLLTHSIFQAQVDSMLNNPEQGFLGRLTAGNFIGAPVYHIAGQYPNTGKPFWTYNRQTETIHFLGMYNHDGQRYNKIHGTGDGPNHI